MRVYCETYGCTANRGDTEAMLGLLEEAGHRLTQNPEDADILLINTCAVKGATYRRMLRRIGELLETQKRVLVAGCLPLIDPKSVLAMRPHGVISCRTLDRVVTVAEALAGGETGIFWIDGKRAKRAGMPKHRLHGVSAIVSIAEGCTSSCTYCSVRLARGAIRSLEIEEVTEEVKSAVSSGLKEILLTAQDTAAYGADTGRSLPELLERICALEGNFMVRVGMMNPRNAKKILPGLLRAYESERVYKFLHLPLQSGDDGILELMGRGYRAEDYINIVNEFRNAFPDLYLATDVIAGFPGEGEREFKRTVEVLEMTAPDKVNISRFSPMPGTEAAGLPRPGGREVSERSRALYSLARRIGSEINRTYLGREWWGLITEPGKRGGYTVRLPNYKPAVVPEGTPGDFIKIRVTGSTPTYLLAENLGKVG